MSSQNPSKRSRRGASRCMAYGADLGRCLRFPAARSRHGRASDSRGYYSFDHGGVHFVGIVNVMHFRPNGLGGFGEDQLAGLHTARSTTFSQPTAGNGPGPVPLTITRDQLPRMLGVTTVTFAGHPGAAALHDSTIA